MLRNLGYLYNLTAPINLLFRSQQVIHSYTQYFGYLN